MSARILVIEDNAANLELMEYLLQQLGDHQVSTATDGIEGLAAAQSELPDLIICDVRMPNMDGYGLVQAVKSDAALQHIPVLAVTASVMADEQQKILQAGFDGYFTKPIEPADFVPQIERFLTFRVEAPDGNDSGGR